MNGDPASSLRPRSKGIAGFVTLSLTVAALLLFLTDLALGPVAIPVEAVIHILVGNDVEQQVWSSILWNIRFPKAVTAVISGVGLSLAGLKLQTLFRNPLAGPSVLGITAGGSLGVAMVTLASGAFIGVSGTGGMVDTGSWGMVLAAVLGSAAVLLVVLAVSMRVRDNVTLLIIGLMVGNITISLVSIWQYFSHPEKIQDYLLWTFGSLGGVTGGQLQVLAAVVLITVIFSMGLARGLNGMLLGEDHARSIGFNVRGIRIGVIVTTSLIAGAVTAFCGPIGFVGVAVPHLARALFNTADHFILMPATALMGAVLMLGCDVLAHFPGSESTLPISAVTALIGSPVVIAVILRRRKLRGSF